VRVSQAGSGSHASEQLRPRSTTTTTTHNQATHAVDGELRGANLLLQRVQPPVLLLARVPRLPQRRDLLLHLLRGGLVRRDLGAVLRQPLQAQLLDLPPPRRPLLAVREVRHTPLVARGVVLVLGAVRRRCGIGCCCRKGVLLRLLLLERVPRWHELRQPGCWCQLLQ
jgi:hypothetical protein